MAQASLAISGAKNEIPSILRSLLGKGQEGVVRIAPGIAARILNECNFDGQRARKPYRVGEHLARINKEQWNSQFPITVVTLPDGAMWLVDGQHRLDAISQSGRTIDARVNIMHAKSEHEARRIYAGFDRPESNRTVGEMLDGLHAAADSGLRRDTVRCLFRALPLILNNMEIAKTTHANAHVHSVEARIDLLSSWTKEAALCEAIHATAERALKNPLYGASVMAVMLYTLRHQPGRAQEFWNGVINGGALAKTDPRQRLMWNLLNRDLGSGSARQGVQMCSLAWTRWNEGARMSIIKCVEGAPIVIWGTPLAKGNRKC